MPAILEATAAAFFPSPLAGEGGAERSSATGEGKLSLPMWHPHPPSLREGTFSRKGRREAPRYRVPNVVAPNSAFRVAGCERQYCGGTET
jgi:hypothetical protein